MTELKTNYEYAALVTEVIDGDTIGCRVDLGFGVHYDDRFRLFGIDAPELRGDDRLDGLRSKQWLIERILARHVKVKTHKDKKDRDKKGKYGRYLAEVVHAGQNIGDAMVADGLAVYKDY